MAKTNLRFRDYTQADREPCLALFDANGAAIEAYAPRREFERFLSLVPSYAPDRGRYLVARDSEHRIVAAGGWIRPVGFGYVSLVFLLVDPARQRQGVGQAMLSACLQRIRSLAGVERVDAEVPERVTAFFFRAGFMIEEIFPNAEAPGIHLIDVALALEPRAGDDKVIALARHRHQKGLEALARLAPAA